MPILTANHIVKRYGGVLALDDMSFTLEPGEAHCLLGANGCGKSTLCKVVSGVVQPDSGTVDINGQVRASLTPAESRELGVSVVYQELSLIPRLSVEDNLLLGVEPRTGLGFVDARERRRKALEVLETFKDVIPLRVSYLRKAVGDLPPDERQIVEIAKTLARDSHIVIFDEATASLHKRQVETLFELVGRLKAKGMGIIVISHRMEEIKQVGDRATIMRNGRFIDTVDVGTTPVPAIIELMTGVHPQTAAAALPEIKLGEMILETKDLVGNNLNGIEVTLRRGEVVGLGGLQGQGQAELLGTLFGFLPREGGTMRVGGAGYSPASPRDAMRRRLAYISGDRKVAGVFLNRPIFDNLVINHLVNAGERIIRRHRLVDRLTPFIEKVRLKYDRLSDPVRSLSGGTQQKVVIGKWLMAEPEILLLDDPTKGVDVQTTREFYDIVRRLCAEGAAILWYSSDDTELLNNTHRTLVFCDGKVVDELAGARLNEYELYKAAIDSCRYAPAEKGKEASA